MRKTSPVFVIVLSAVLAVAGYVAWRLSTDIPEEIPQGDYLVVTESIHVVTDYVLEKDVFFSGTGAAFIVHNNVVFDGNGHKIMGLNSTQDLQTGMVLESVSNVIVKDVEIVGIYWPIRIHDGRNVTIANNYLHDCVEPDRLAELRKKQIETGWGITVRYSKDSLDPRDAVIIANNTIVRVGNQGIHAAYNYASLLVANNTIVDCIGQQMKVCMTNAGFRIIGNTFIGGEIGLFITNDNSYLVIEKNRFIDNVGIYLRYPRSKENRIIANRFYDSGIKIEDTDGNTIEHNKFHNVTSTIPIRLKASSRNKVHHNFIENCSVGMSLESFESVPSAENEIYENEIAEARIGLILDNAARNIVHNNLIANSTQYGICIQRESRDNLIQDNAIWGSGISDLFEDASSKGLNTLR